MKKITAIAMLSLMPYGAFAQVFKAEITVFNPDHIDEPSRTKTLRFNEATNFFDQLSTGGFKRAFGDYYNSKTLVEAKTNYRGLPMDIAFDPKTSNYTLSIDKIGIKNKSFKGISNKAASDKIERYFRHNEENVMGKVEKWLTGNSSATVVDPIVTGGLGGGGGIVTPSFDINPFPSPSTNQPTVTTTAKPIGSTKSSGSQIGTGLAVGVGGGNYTRGGSDISIFSVPLSTSFEIDSSDPRKKLLLNGQFSYITLDQAETYQGSVGLGYMHPLTDNWYLIPSVNYGAVGSKDLATAGQLFSTSIASHYQHKLGEYTLSMINHFGFFKTLPLEVGNFSNDPDLSNYIIKNGFFVSRNLEQKIFGHTVNVKGIFTDTEFLGSKLFVRQYNEVGVELNTVDKVKWLNSLTFGMADSLTFSAKYVFSVEDSNKFSGYDIGIGYDF